MVRSELDRDPEVGLDALFDKAREIDPAVAELSRRQFHARYPLQVKRTRGQGAGPRKRAPGKRATRAAAVPGQGQARRRRGRGEVDRDAIRRVFLDFAADLAEAESRQDLVRVLRSTDDYVDRVQKMLNEA